MGGTPPPSKSMELIFFFISYMGSKKCFNAKKFFFLFFPEYLPLILGVPKNVEVPNPNFRGFKVKSFIYFRRVVDQCGCDWWFIGIALFLLAIFVMLIFFQLSCNCLQTVFDAKKLKLK